MIKLFRNIRKTLVTEGKTINYLKYAIGEIVLVVIGILIALQINNWNETQKNHSLEQAYIKNLIDDIKGDINFTNHFIIDRYDRKIAALEMGKGYYQGTYTVKDTLSFLNEISYGGVFSGNLWGFEKTTYNELISTGRFRIISNDSLRKAILNYYLFQNRITEGSANTTETGYTNFINSKTPFDSKNPEFKSDFDQKFLLKSLRSEKFYELLNLEITNGKLKKYTADNVLDEANKLLQVLERQMNKNN